MDATYVCEVTVYDPAAGGGSGAAVTKYYATKGWASLSTDTPSEQHFDERLKQPLQINRTMFSPNATRGRSTVGYGDIVLVNGDGELDAFTTYGVDGRTIKVYRGQIGDAYPGSWLEIFNGTMQGVEVTQEFVSLKIRDALSFLNVPLQTTKYTGGGLGTLEGTEDTIKGKPKPICYGTVRNIAPPCVETAKLIYQVSDGLVSSIPSVYDRGVTLAASLATWDQETFDDLPGGLGNPVWGAAYGNGVWVIVTNVSGGGIFFSTDGGATWDTGTSPFSAGMQIGTVHFANGVFMAGATTTTDREFAYSADGDTWTLASSVEAGSGLIVSIAYHDGVWVAGSANTGSSPAAGILASQDDGDTWTDVSPTNFFSTFLSRGGKKFVAMGTVTGSANLRLAYSDDGLTWTLVLAAATGLTNSSGSCAYLSTIDRWVVASGSAGVLVSADGATWNAYSGSFFGGASPSFMMETIQGVLLAVTNAGGYIYTSDDGITWYRRENASWTTPEWWSAAQDDDGKILIGGRDLSPSPDVTAGLFTRGFKTYASSADLLDDSLAPEPGTYGVFLDASGSYFRLGAAPSGLVTANVIQGAAASNRTTAQVWKNILDERAGLSSGDWNATDVSDHDTANNDVIGYWTDQESRVADVIDAVKDSSGSASYIDAGGVFRLKVFAAPSGSAVLSITANDLIKPLRRILPSEQGQGIPQYRTILRYQKNYTPQTTDVAASVTDSRRAFLAKEWREIADTDTAVQAKHLLAIESVEETLLDVAADVTTEADRRQTLRGADRQMFEAWLQLNDDTDALDLNDVIEITHPRYGLSGGELARIIGHNVNVEKRELALTLFL